MNYSCSEHVAHRRLEDGEGPPPVGCLREGGARSDGKRDSLVRQRTEAESCKANEAEFVAIWQIKRDPQLARIDTRGPTSPGRLWQTAPRHARAYTRAKSSISACARPHTTSARSHNCCSVLGKLIIHTEGKHTTSVLFSDFSRLFRSLSIFDSRTERASRSKAQLKALTNRASSSGGQRGTVSGGALGPAGGWLAFGISSLAARVFRQVHGCFDQIKR